MNKPLFNASGMPVGDDKSVSPESFYDFAPLHGFVHIRRVKLAGIKTQGGVLIPENINQKASVFEVIATGPGYLDPTTGVRQPMSVKSGDYVLIDLGRVVNLSYAGQEELFVVQDADIYGLVQFRPETKGTA